MVYVTISTWYPSHKGSEVGKIYAEVLQKYSPDKSLWEMVVPVAAKGTKDGIETIAIYKPKEDKIKQVITRFIEVMANFNDIEGYEYAIEVWAGVEDIPT